MNYTPLDINKIKSAEKTNSLNTLLLGAASLTSLVFVVLLFVLIQKKVQEPVTTTTDAKIQEIIAPTLEPTMMPTLEPSPTLISTPTATISPTTVATPSPTIKP